MHELDLVVSARPAAVTRIVLGGGALAALPEAVAGAAAVLLVTERRVAETPWPGRAAGIIEATGGPLACTTVLEPGEEHKTIAAVRDLWEAWSTASAGRDARVVAVGGGVVTDIAGFAAATFLRGVDWIAVPTTLLGMADAAIGGKTGVNAAAGKNLAGAVHHPRAVIADLDCLATLPAADQADGWAEVVKAAVIGDAALLDELEREAEAVARRDVAVIERLLWRGIAVKAKVVSADAEEGSRREILNFGHTVAHAVEQASCHAVSHGRAVAVGIASEALLGEARHRLPQGTSRRIGALCRRLGLDVPKLQLDERAVTAALLVDKKRRAGRLRVALPSGLGAHDAHPGVFVELEEVLAGLAEL